MQFIDQFLKLVQQGLATIFSLIGGIWHWTVTQISAVPWNKLDQLSIPKIVLLVLVAGAVIYLLYLAGKELLGAGEKLLSAFVAVLTVFVKTLPYILIAGAAAAGGAWIINHVKI